MEIELPDGTVLEAPDDADIKAVVRGYTRQQGIAKLKAQNPEEYDTQSEAFQQKNAPVEYIDAPVRMRGAGTGAAEGGGVRSMRMADPSVENFRAGIGSGMLRSAKGLTNLMLPDSMTPDWASDENIQEMDRRDTHLPESGKLVGSTVASLPVSGAVGKGLELTSRAVKMAGTPLARVLAEGATQGAIFADPDEQGTGALVGAGVGGALHGLSKFGGRLTRGLVEKSEAAQDLDHLAAKHGEEIFTPISQSASDDGFSNRMFKAFYREALPIVPGVRGKLIRQSDEAAEKLREIAIREGLPTGSQLPPEAGKKVSQATATIQDEFDKAYDATIKSYAFNVPTNLKSDLTAAIRAKAGPKTTVNDQTLSKVNADVRALIDKFSNGGKVLDGSNLLNVKREIGDLLTQAKGHEKFAYQAADEYMDDLVRKELSQGGNPQNLADLKAYEDLTPAYRAFKPVKAAAESSPEQEGRFLFRTLARKAKKSPEQRDLGRIGAATLDRSPVTSGITGKILAGMGTLGAGFGAYMSPAAALTAIVGGNALASRPAQRLLLGDTKMQKLLIEALRKNPDLIRRLGSVTRAAAVSQTRGDGE